MLKPTEDFRNTLTYVKYAWSAFTLIFSIESCITRQQLNPILTAHVTIPCVAVHIVHRTVERMVNRLNFLCVLIL